MSHEAEMPEMRVSREQLRVICTRYYLASQFVSGRSVLEVGCGPGLGLGYLAKRAKKVVGGDYAEDNLRCAQRHYGGRKQYNGRIELLALDAHKLPFRENCFDVVVAMATVYALQLGKFLDECHRVLKNEGVLVFCMPNKDVPGFCRSKLSHEYYSVPELSALLNQHQFDAKFFGAFPVLRGSEGRQRARATMLGKMSKALDLVPRGLKEFLDKFILHKTVLKAELGEENMKIIENIQLTPIPHDYPDSRHRVLYTVAHARDVEMHLNKQPGAMRR